MPESVRLIDPGKLSRNPDNPRIIFRQEDLDALMNSISEQGILVPLTVFRDKDGMVILDGERRWRCALKLSLSSVPVIIQPKPDKMQNIMMMFAIHNARTDWDPLPTALKLRELEKEFEARNNRKPNEVELAGLASISRGEVRRLKKLLGLPESYKKELLEELEKPKSQQQITVDHVLEITRGAEALKKRKVIDDREEDQLRQSLISKYRSKVEINTVAPRKLARLARSIDRGEVSISVARRVSKRLIEDANYSIQDAFQQSVEQVDFEHGFEQIITRIIIMIKEHKKRGYKPSDKLLKQLAELQDLLERFVGD